MEAIRIESTVLQGRVLIDNLPFEDGKNVEIIVLEKNSVEVNSENRYPLRGTPYQYEDPFSPLISLEEWEPFK